MKWERRSVTVHVTPNDAGPQQDGLPRQFWARVLNYDTVDDYGTMFAPGAFTESLQRRLPRLMYGHAGWENPAALLGRGIEYRDSREGLDVLFEFDDFDYVPMARQIAHQMHSGTLDQFSIGFIRQRDGRAANGKTQITKGRLGETSVVVEGSVPGTKLLAFRSAQRTMEPVALVDANLAANILARFSLGELDLEHALAAVRNAVVVNDEESPDREEPSGESAGPPAGTDESDADTQALDDSTPNAADSPDSLDDDESQVPLDDYELEELDEIVTRIR